MNDEKTIMVAPYPKAEDYVFDAAAEKDILWIKDFVTAVRNLRAEMKAGPGVKLAPIVRGASEDEQRCAKDNSRCLTLVANIEPIVFADNDAKLPPCASKPFGTAEVLIPMKDLVNKDAEIKRLNDMANKLKGLIKGGEAKLNNEAFTSKAPAKIIEGAKAQLELNKAQLSKIESQIEELSKL